MADHEKHDEHGGESHEGGSHGGGGHGGGAHGGGSHEEHEGAPEWLISFADNVALMMGFFVILLAMNMSPDKKKYGGGEPGKEGPVPNAAMIDAAISIRAAFNNPVDPDNPNESPEFVRRLKQRAGEGEEADIEGKGAEQHAVRPSDYINAGASIPFDDRQTLLTTAGRKTIAEFAAKVRGSRWMVELRGHVSPSEVMRDENAALDLSYKRAMAVRQLLLEQGITSEQLRLVACGTSDRIVPRTYDRAKDRGNQRVEIVITKDTMPEDPYSKQVFQGGGNE